MHTTHVSIRFNCTNLSDIPFGIERLVQIFHMQQDGQLTIGKERTVFCIMLYY